MLIKMSQSPKDRYCMMRYREVKFREQRLVEWWLTEAGREGGVTVISEYRVSVQENENVWGINNSNDYTTWQMYLMLCKNGYHDFLKQLY